MNQSPATLALTVAQWAALVKGGANLTVKTRLDGVSMQPLIRKGRDTVTIAPLHRPLKRGDVVLFYRADGAYVVHRLRRITGETLVTLGDNCWREDAPIPARRVLGIAVQAQRGKRTFSLDTPLSRGLGRCWMACHGLRIMYRRGRGAILRRLKGIIQWKKPD